MSSYLMSHGAGVGYGHFDVVEAIGDGHILYDITGVEYVLKLDGDKEGERGEREELWREKEGRNGKTKEI